MTGPSPSAAAAQAPTAGDVSEKDRLLAQYAEVASLAGGLAHEIRNPLSTIRMNLELLGEDVEELDDPRRQRMLRKIERIQLECGHLEEVLTAFLQFSRAGELETEIADLGGVVKEFIAFYEPEARRLGVELSPHLDADLPPVRLDRALIRQVLMNLALNAQQAMPDGGMLELQAYRCEEAVCLDIIDSGCGIDPSAQQRMFQAFFSTKPGGSGLGLPTARKIIEAHGGTIHCESEPRRGSRFTIRLPAADPE
ncbi:MAG: two-component sensor histidine kinase [Planctomycetota bacterium]|nr:MAG: two-component sensor histidine kinase [Planctomycetota bacterium]REK35340.1 MAG: two-component sensor histidine kinase [Planctomycetota bacterium]